MVSSRPRRRKRASATQLYQTCKAAGTCPPDVVNKVEQTTVADQILKWGSMGVFFGGLGIGSGSGSGGRAGYVPLSTGSRAIPPKSLAPDVIARPPVVVDTVAPTDPSIVSLIEESSIIQSGAPSPVIPTEGGFSITSSGTDVPAILDISSTNTVHVTSTTHHNPIFTDPSVVQPIPPVEASGRIIVSHSSITTGAAEEIPMDTFVVHSDPLSSTPVPGVSARPKVGLYSKALQQVEIVDPTFMSTPQRLITYDNPVFDNIEDTLHFEQPSIHNAPDPAFMDIITLHRPALTSRRGVVRFSRVGQRGTMYTRRGTRIGGRVHFFKDISPIASSEEIELHPLVASPNNSDLFDVYADIDDIDENILYSTIDNNTPTSTYSLYPGNSTRIANTSIPLATIPDTFLTSGPDIVFPSVPAGTPYLPVSPSIPAISVLIRGTDYYLNPAYYFRKRRKRILAY
ncbi:late protein [Human papillomavirus type 7]|uniref:Minor capsid protein L2 n=2 Tax=Human papillomavirus 7 TaxID=10620 RepID=VL2_HPV07|nr:late protein [Human papillomavirus type 7]P36745.1 RecName: Full=Minor capsid protein L2 [Human papillomavirus type 7]QEE83791.1 L2 [Human papillomavirus type 7]QEE83798.1 L2 [Human papillomavirus type 7]QEE83806.1 L2 [Human papillomavirus type 7]QEE83813.1 L2 [Human papillomavirus type 7]CAA52480.1 late protein [Human papillomavirus type 7]